MIQNMTSAELTETKRKIRAVWRRMERGGAVRWEILERFYDDIRAEEIRRGTRGNVRCPVYTDKTRLRASLRG